MNPGETHSVDLAMRDEVDCFVNVGTDAGAHFPIQAVQHLKKHPFIAVDPNFCMASEISDLHIPVRIAVSMNRASCTGWTTSRSSSRPFSRAFPASERRGIL